MAAKSLRKTITKDPDATNLDFNIDWRLWLNGDILLSSEWAVTPGIDVNGVYFTEDGVSTIWVGGGVLGSTYELTNKILTVGARQDERTLYIVISE